MNIVFFNSCKNWGGGEKWHFEMASALSDRGHEVHFFAAKGSPLYKKVASTNIKLQDITVSSLSFLNPFKLTKLYSYLKKINANHIIINLSADLKIAGLAAKKAKIPNIIYRRGSAIPIKNRFLNRFLFSKIVSSVIANSEETKQTINAINKSMFPNDRIAVIYNGIHTEEYPAKEKKLGNKIILGNLARLSRQKGHKYLISLAKKLKNNGIDFEMRLGGEGELSAEIHHIIKHEQLEDCVKMLGFIEKPVDFLNEIDILVFPSIWEGFGFSIVEAKLCKKPVVAFNITSNPEVLRDGEDGYLVPAFDENELYEKVVLLARDSELRQRLGEAGRNDAMERFSFPMSVSKIEAYLKELQKQAATNH